MNQCSIRLGSCGTGICRMVSKPSRKQESTWQIGKTYLLAHLPG